MDFKQLSQLCGKHEVRIDNHGNYKQTPPYYYDSLRPAFGYYFNTFDSFNHFYESYAEGLSGRNVSVLQRQLLDEENTMLTLVTFERFFELFLKNLLGKAHFNLVHKPQKRMSFADLLKEIEAGTFTAYAPDGIPYTIPFRETISRFYKLIDLSKNGNTSPVVTAFTKIFQAYPFFDSDDYKASLELINWYRDRILHNGSSLPNMWMLDYLVTQRFIPIVRDIVKVDINDLGQSLFYFKTPSGIDVVEKLSEVVFDFADLTDGSKIQETYENLLKIGHLKEMGRASLNMDLYQRSNQMAHNEYNYKDPQGRGKRFALAEKQHQDFKDIQNCPCCGVESLVHYRMTIKDVVPPHNMVDIDWVKCYTCNYHIRYNVHEPAAFGLNSKEVFS